MKKYVLKLAKTTLQIAAAFCMLITLASSVALAEQQKSELAEAPQMKFIALQKNYTAAPRKTVAQKPPLRFFSTQPRNVPSKISEPEKKLEMADASEMPASFAQAKTGSMSKEQAQLILSIFEEPR